MTGEVGLLPYLIEVNRTVKEEREVENLLFKELSVWRILAAVGIGKVSSWLWGHRGCLPSSLEPS